VSSDYLVVTNKAYPSHLGKIIAWDTEAVRQREGDIEIQSFYNADFYDGDDHYYTERREDILHIIWELMKKYVFTGRRPFARITLISHNTPYDIRVSGLAKILREGQFLGMSLKKALIDKVFLLDFGRVIFLDTFNFFKAKLSTLAKEIGLKKVDENEYKLEPEEWNKRLKIDGKERVQTDTEILYKYFMNFYNDPEFTVGFTIASTSLKTFRKRFLRNKMF